MNGQLSSPDGAELHAFQCPPGPITAHTAEHLLGVSIDMLERCATTLRDAIVTGSAIYTFGNGGSATTASHLACDLFHKRNGVRGRRARSTFLYDTASSTAIANDHGFDEIFASPLRMRLERGDVLVAISVSGDSPNILKALEVGRECGATNVALLGCDGGRALALADLAVVTPCVDPGVVESVHLAIVHDLAVRANATHALDQGVLVR